MRQMKVFHGRVGACLKSHPLGSAIPQCVGLLLVRTPRVRSPRHWFGFSEVELPTDGTFPTWPGHWQHRCVRQSVDPKIEAAWPTSL